MDHHPSPQPVTLRTIAERASLSISAVSLALRNHPSIPEVTRARIQKIASELGYRPNAMVSTLMARIHTRRPMSESPVLGLIFEGGVADIYEQVPFYRDLLQGAHKRASQLGYQAENIPLTPGDSGAMAMYRVLHTRNIRGVIIMPLAGETECRLSFTGLAACALGYTLHKPDLHRVVPNYAQGMRLTWDKLMAKGYRRPGFINTESHLRGTNYERYAAFVAQQAMHPEVAAIPPLIFAEGSSEENVDACMALFLKWFRLHRPDVLIYPPWYLLKRLSEAVKIPQDVGVILADMEPDWCVVKEDARGIGAGSVDLVVAQIHRNETGVPLKPKLVAINNDWVEGFSLPAKG